MSIELVLVASICAAAVKYQIITGIFLAARISCSLSVDMMFGLVSVSLIIIIIIIIIIFVYHTRVVSCNWMSVLVAPSGECLRGECLVWLIGAVVC